MKGAGAVRSGRSDPAGGLAGQLVSELADVPTLQTLSGRHQLLALIRRGAPGFADVAEWSVVRQHLIEIVLECLRQPARLPVLVGALELMTPDDRAVQRIRSLVSGANVRDVLPDADLDEVRHLLERVRPDTGWVSRFDAAAAESAWHEPVPSAITLVLDAAGVASRPVANLLMAWADRQLDRFDLHHEPDSEPGSVPEPELESEPEPESELRFEPVSEKHEETPPVAPADTVIPPPDDGEDAVDAHRLEYRPIPRRVRFAAGAAVVTVLVSMLALNRCADLDARDDGRKSASTQEGANAGSPSPTASRSPSHSPTPSPAAPVGDVTLTLSTSGGRRCEIHIDDVKDMWLGVAVRVVGTGKVPSPTAVTIASNLGETAFVSLNKENTSDNAYLYFNDNPSLRYWALVVPAARVPAYLNRAIDLHVTVDPSDVVRETNEQNNILTFRFALPASVDRVEREDYRCSLVG